MKAPLPRILTLCATLTALAAAGPSNAVILQRPPLAQTKLMAEPESTVEVPGSNNATYGPVPREEQLFQIEFLEIAPLPIPVNRIVFLLLRGIMPQANNKDPATATLSITLTLVLPDGTREDPATYTIPLRTTSFGDPAHLLIRDAAGDNVDHLTSGGRNDILVDSVIPSTFLRTGMWTFDVVARLEDGTCLFAVSLTQWLKGIA